VGSAPPLQVHTARDKVSNRKLAVKVQHRGLRETSSADLCSLTGVVHLLEALFPEDFTFSW